MNYVCMILNPEEMPFVEEICRQLAIPFAVQLLAHGTAEKKTLDFLGLISRERRVVMCMADFEKSGQLLALLKRRLYIDIPGNGVVMTMPVKCVGGKKVLAYLSGNQKPFYVPSEQYPYELIIAIANEGYTDMVMDAARAGGATGGTVLHGKGTGGSEAETFLQVSLAKEKEVILIVAKAAQKAEIMRSVLNTAGPSSKAGTVLFSLPVKDTAGFAMTEDE